jgi:hypothetical protein
VNEVNYALFWKWMLSPNGKKQEISYLYLHALVTNLGYSLERVVIDMDSVDATICAKGEIEGSRGILLSPKIDVQLKATEREPVGDPISINLSKKNYDELRQNAMVPRMAIVLFLSKDWFKFDVEKISVFGKGYWMSLKGMADSNNQSDVTLHIPQSQRLMDETIQQWMIAAANREELAYVPC